MAKSPCGEYSYLYCHLEKCGEKSYGEKSYGEKTYGEMYCGEYCVAKRPWTGLSELQVLYNVISYE